MGFRGWGFGFGSFLAWVGWYLIGLRGGVVSGWYLIGLRAYGLLLKIWSVEFRVYVGLGSDGSATHRGITMRTLRALCAVGPARRCLGFRV
jgi:hypothetical protein